MKIENKYLAFVLLFSFLLYFLTLSKGLNVYDAPEYAKEGLEFVEDGNIEHLVKTQYFRNPLYLVTSLPMFYISKFFPIEFLLNFYSLLPTLLSVFFVYKLSEIFLNSKEAILAAVLFALIPWIWFNSIIADAYSIVVAMNTGWLYFLISGLKIGEDKRLFYSTLFLTLSILAHITSAPLIFVHAYFILSYRKNFKWLIKHSILILPALPILLYFSYKVFLLGGEYKISYSFSTFVFGIALLIWNFIHGLSFPLFIISLLSVAYVNKIRKRSKTLNNLFISFVLILLVYIPFLTMPNYTLILIFQAVFPVIPIIVMLFLKKFKKALFVYAILLIFIFLKFLPVVINLQYPHPHELYAKFANDVLEKNSTIFVGHEMPFYKMYTSNFKLYGEGDVVNVSKLSSPVYITSQYIENENEVEFKGFKKLPIYKFFSNGYSTYSSIVFSGKILNITNLKVKAVYTKEVRDMEDTYEWLYSVYGNILLKLFTAYDFPYLQYKIYEVKS